ncbi:MAG: hypothetical protein LBR69_01955 [Endomicrobium sp.]|jgi:hypothetical protein|nr:hypothetical protein [Endomicrobium sp.]
MNKLIKILNNKRVYFAILAVLLGIFFARLIHLDSDLPSFGVALYAPVDEGTYSIMALNKYIYGEVNVKNQELNSFTYPTHRINVLGNALSYLSLNIFGRNYAGLRMPSVVWAFLTLLLALFILNKLLQGYAYKRPVILLSAVIFTTSFAYLMVSRVVEPSVVRMFCAVLLFALYVSGIKPFLKFFLMGALLSVSLYFVYVTNIFFLLPCALMLFVDLYETKRVLNSLMFILGAVSVAVLGEHYYKTVWGLSYLQNAIDSVSAFASTAGYESTTKIGHLYKNFRYFFSNNGFMFNMPLFFMSLYLLPPLVFGIFKKRDINALVLSAFIIGLLFQTIYSQDYILRKGIIIFPHFLILTMLSLKYFNSFLESMWGSELNNAGISFEFNRKIFRISKENLKIPFARAYFAFFAFTGLVALIFCSNRLFFTSSNARIDFSIYDKLGYIVFQAAPVICTIAYGYFKVFNNKISPASFKKFLFECMILIFACGFLFNVLLSFEYIFFKPSFKNKESMIKLGKYVGNDYVLGEWAYAHALYNDIMPVENTYEKLTQYLIEKPGAKILLYSNYSIDPVLIETLLSKHFVFKEEYKIDKSYTTYGEMRPFALYSVIRFKEYYYKLFPRKDRLYYPCRSINNTSLFMDIAL